MNTIIHEIMEKVTIDYEKVMGKLIDDIVKGREKYQKLIKDLRKC